MQTVSTIYPGVRYREHKTRKYNGQPDKYFMIRYKIDGKFEGQILEKVRQGLKKI